jgi:hypothetical protein
VKHKGRTLIDGGLASPVPVDLLVRAGVSKIIAVNTFPNPEAMKQYRHAEEESRIKPSELKRPMHETGPLIDTPTSIIKLYMRFLNSTQARVAQDACTKADVVISPTVPDGFWYDFYNPERYIRRGEQVAEAALPQLKELVGDLLLLAGGEVEHLRQTLEYIFRIGRSRRSPLSLLHDMRPPNLRDLVGGEDSLDLLFRVLLERLQLLMFLLRAQARVVLDRFHLFEFIYEDRFDLVLLAGREVERSDQTIKLLWPLQRSAREIALMHLLKLRDLVGSQQAFDLLVRVLLQRLQLLLFLLFA